MGGVWTWVDERTKVRDTRADGELPGHSTLSAGHPDLEARKQTRKPGRADGSVQRPASSSRRPLSPHHYPSSRTQPSGLGCLGCSWISRSFRDSLRVHFLLDVLTRPTCPHRPTWRGVSACAGLRVPGAGAAGLGENGNTPSAAHLQSGDDSS